MRIIKIERKETTKDYVFIDITIEKRIGFKTKVFTKNFIYEKKNETTRYCDTSTLFYLDGYYIDTIIAFIQTEKKEIIFN